MIGDKDGFVKMKKEKEGSATFGNDDSFKIIGKETITLGNEGAHEYNLLLSKNMRHNPLNVIHMCDQGYYNI